MFSCTDQNLPETCLQNHLFHVVGINLWFTRDLFCLSKYSLKKWTVISFFCFRENKQIPVCVWKRTEYENIHESICRMNFTAKVTDILGPRYEFVDSYRTKELTLRDLLSHRTGLARLDYAGTVAGISKSISRTEFCRWAKDLCYLNQRIFCKCVQSTLDVSKFYSNYV